MTASTPPRTGSEGPLDDVPDDVRPSLAQTMIGNMLFNLRQPQRSCDREEIVRCLEHVEAALSRDLATANTARLAAEGERDRAVAEEREACACLADAEAADEFAGYSKLRAKGRGDRDVVTREHWGAYEALDGLAAAIRARAAAALAKHDDGGCRG